MPSGWTQDGDRWCNDGVSAQADAIERGGAFHINLATKTLDLCPWTDGSDDCLSMRPVLPDGVTAGAVSENSWGWKYPLSNGWKLWLLDMQGSKIPDALDDFLADGVAVVYTNIPIDEVPLTGEWRPKKIRFLAGYEDYTFAIQPDESGNPDVTQPLWVPGSIAIYHNSKVNNRPGARYMTGKVAHLPRPLMVGWRNGDVTGYAFGVYEDLGGGVFEKVFDMDAIIASGDLTMEGIGNPQTVSVSADLGYTSMGASSIAYNVNLWASSELSIPITGNITKWTIGDDDDWSLGGTHQVAAYKGVHETATLQQEDLTPSAVATADGTGFFNAVNTSPPIAVVSGEDWIIAAQSDVNTRFDSSAPAFTTRRVVNTLGSFPDPIGPSTGLGVFWTAFFTIEEGGGGGGTSDQSSLAIDLSMGL